MTDTNIDPNDLLLRRSIKWRVAAGWVMVCILTMRYILHPLADIVLVMQGLEPLQPLPPIEWTDVLAIIGLPVGGAFADRMTGD